jgi:SAM-dependent methyltransferase
MSRISTIDCYICGARIANREFQVTRPDKWGSYVSPHTSGPATYFECSHCEAMLFKGSWEYGDAYSDGFYYGVDGDTPAEFLEKRFRQILSLPKAASDNESRIRRIGDFLKSRYFHKEGPARVLDVGAGMGVFLSRFVDSCWDGVAVEPDPNACQHLRKFLPNILVYEGISSGVNYNTSFDLITLNRVLEHISDPVGVLASERDHLSDGGYIYLELPDTQSYYKDGLNNEAFGYGHLIVYSPIAIGILARRAGLDLVHMNRVVEPSGKFTIYGFLTKKTNKDF